MFCQQKLFFVWVFLFARFWLVRGSQTQGSEFSLHPRLCVGVTLCPDLGRILCQDVLPPLTSQQRLLLSRTCWCRRITHKIRDVNFVVDSTKLFKANGKKFWRQLCLKRTPFVVWTDVSKKLSGCDIHDRVLWVWWSKVGLLGIKGVFFPNLRDSFSSFFSKGLKYYWKLRNYRKLIRSLELLMVASHLWWFSQ